MKIKEYIESGIIESCVLGLATESEQRELASLCINHPEIVEAKYTFEVALEDMMMNQVVVPPDDLKQQILLSLQIAEENSTVQKPEAVSVPKYRINFWRWVAAASVLLLIASGYWVNSMRYQYQELQAVNAGLENRLVEANRNDAIVALHPIIQKPSVKWSTMVEPANPGHCMAHIYWDSLSNNTYLLLGNIPKPLADKQFQLWALQDSNPINLGLFDIKKEGQLVRMRNLYKAGSFVITIEPKGGSAIPTLKATYAVGQL